VSPGEVLTLRDADEQEVGAELLWLIGPPAAPPEFSSLVQPEFRDYFRQWALFCRLAEGNRDAA
jgi:hypothetical protein